MNLRFLKKLFWVCGFLYFLCFDLSAQLIEPFDIRYGISQKGGIRMLSNVSVSCGASSGCSSTQSQMPPNGSGSNEDFSSMSYVDIDSDPSTFMSSSDSLALEDCSEILWAGLYWSAEINSSVSGFNTRNTVKMKVNSSSYIDYMSLLYI